jgi:hypothetical protein
VFNKSQNYHRSQNYSFEAKLYKQKKVSIPQLTETLILLPANNCTGYELKVRCRRWLLAFYYSNNCSIRNIKSDFMDINMISNIQLWLLCFFGLLYLRTGEKYYCKTTFQDSICEPEYLTALDMASLSTFTFGSIYSLICDMQARVYTSWHWGLQTITCWMVRKCLWVNYNRND